MPDRPLKFQVRVACVTEHNCSLRTFCKNTALSAFKMPSVELRGVAAVLPLRPVHHVLPGAELPHAHFRPRLVGFVALGPVLQASLQLSQSEADKHRVVAVCS